MKGVSVRTLILLVIGIAIVGASFFILINQVGAIDIKKYIEDIPIPGVPAEISYGTLPTQITVEDTPESEHIITSPGDPYQPSEIGCKIADYIFDDYKEKGDGLARPEPFLWDGGRQNSIVGAGTFILGDTLADPGDWETTLNGRADLCHYCGEPVFDEVCINYNLMDREVLGSDFCDGPFATIPHNGFPGGDPAHFGNARCMKGDANTESWKDSCDGRWCSGLLDCCGACPVPCGYPGVACEYDNNGDDFCDNDKDKAVWIVDKPDGDPSDRVKDNNADDDGNSNEISKDPHKYIYGVIWDAGEKQFDVLFVRIPQTRNENNFDWIAESLLDWTRYNRLGFAYHYARMVDDVDVTGVDKGVMDLRGDIADEIALLNLDDIVHEICSDEDSCLASGDEYGYPVNPDSGTVECEGERTPVTLKTLFQRETVKLKTNIDANGEFRASNNYKVRVFNWYGKRDKCYSLVDRQVSIFCTDCCNDDGVCDPIWESVDCGDC
jgi:hypothetical protein